MTALTKEKSFANNQSNVQMEVTITTSAAIEKVLGVKEENLSAWTIQLSAMETLTACHMMIPMKSIVSCRHLLFIEFIR